ncbi:MAG: hypothetical protein K2N74_04320, partial [Clostridiales bacterium]|nr:hypothetical protein [Clostridiales bacterium]
GHSLNDKRSATWYGVLRDDGLDVAVDIYHNDLAYGKELWYKNLNFEIHLGKQNVQHYVYVKSANTLPVVGTVISYNIETSSSDMEAKYTHTGGGQTATHHSIFEVKFPDSMISGWKETDGTIRIGVAIKTNGDYNDPGSEKITGGAYNYAGGDTWYAPYGQLANVYDQFAYVTKDGMYLKNEYEHSDMKFGAASAVTNAGITLDGDISDWAGSHTIGVQGSYNYDGKSVTFYG